MDAFNFVANARLAFRKKKPKKNASQSAIVIIPYKMSADKYNISILLLDAKKII